MRLTKRDVEALLAPLDGDDAEQVAAAVAVALGRCLDRAGGFDELVPLAGFEEGRTAALLRRDPPALWDLATELAERRTV